MRTLRNLNSWLVAIALFAIGMASSSCVHQFPEEDEIGTVHLTVLQDREWLPDTTVYLTRAENQDVVIRYDFKVFPKGNNTYPVKEFTIIKDDLTRQDYTTDLELMPGEYDLYCWSDYAYPDGDPIYYDDDNFAAITYIKPYEGDSDLRDAFRGMTSFTITENGYYELKPVEATITLSRPLARYKFIATDLAEFIDKEITRGKLTNSPDDVILGDGPRYAKLADYKIKVLYPMYMPAVFNNFRNNPVDSWTGVEFTCSMLQLSGTEAQLAMDYVMVNGLQSSVQVMLEVYDPDGMLLARTNTMTIPTKRDRTTLVYSKFLTTIRNDGVGINPDFEGEYNIEIK